MLAGAWNTAFYYLIFAGLWSVVGAQWPYWSILGITSVLATLNAFVTQRQLVFRSQGHIVREFARFSLVYLIIGALNIAVFPELVETYGLDPYVSQALFTVFIVVAGYVANKYFSFRQHVGAQD